MKLLPSNTPLPELAEQIRELGRIWASSNLRRRVVPTIRKHWDSLIDAWADSDLPLAIRKSGGVRGEAITHRSGRKLVLADNSPAQWAFSRAYRQEAYSLSEIRDLLEADRIPFAYATKKAEKSRMTYKCTLSTIDNVNKHGWKLCHIDDVGLNTRTQLAELPIETLINHFRLILKPSNHFLVPLEWAGLGELPEVISEIRKYEELDAISTVAG
jgi:hypothetical protein